MNNPVKYNNNYAKTSGIVYQHCMDDPYDIMTDSELFKSKSRFTNVSNNPSIANVETAVPIKYLSIVAN